MVEGGEEWVVGGLGDEGGDDVDWEALLLLFGWVEVVVALELSA